MMATATCTVSVYRGTVTDDYGDEIANNTTATYAGIPASILEQTRRVTTPDQATPRVVRWHAGRLPGGTDVRAGDRLVDEQGGAVYLVDAISSNGGASHGMDVLLDLRRTS